MKAISGLLLFLTLNFTLFTQTMVITKPRGGETWEIKQGYYLQWKKSGKLSNSVKIRLMSPNGGVKVLEITNKAPNNG